MRYTTLLAAGVLVSTLHAQTAEPHQLARDILTQIIGINSTDTPKGSVTAVAQALQQRFQSAGWPADDLHLLGPNDRKQNLVVRLRGTGAARPLLMICHLDVVEALPSDWTTDPFQLVEKDGYLYGRGTQDMKGADAITATTLLRLHAEGYKPVRDLIVAFTADEEGGKSNGVDWLLKNHRDLVDGEYVLNPDGGGPVLHDGKPYFIDLSASEKAYADYRVSATNPGGHSSLPRPDNAIYEVTDALEKLEHFTFPLEINPVTRAHFEQMAKLETGQRAADMRALLQPTPDKAAAQRLSQDPNLNAIMRTTCVATRLQAGHANNALPQTAEANVNCRIFPGHTREQIRQELIRVFNDPKLKVEYIADNGDAASKAPNAGAITPPPVRPDLLRAAQEGSRQFFNGVPVVPSMEAGASDNIYTVSAGIPSYQMGPVAIDEDDVRAHGKDERIRVTAFNTGVDFYYFLLKALTGGQQ